tara:strand:+ start:72 stop:497 length:426 start_codon:yes stop_codon:yes gene_type:complete
MKIKQLAPNQTEIYKDDGTVIFISYETPVAAFVDGFKWIRSAEKYSQTTSRHINKWLSGLNVETVPQAQIDALMTTPLATRRWSAFGSTDISIATFTSDDYERLTEIVGSLVIAQFDDQEAYRSTINELFGLYVDNAAPPH